MTKRRTAVLICLCGLAGGGWPAGGAAADALTVATYNVENYLAAGRRIDGVYRPDYPKPEAAKRALRDVIRALDADLVALQEMGPAGYLEELRRDLRAEGADYPYSALAEADDPERHLALLSRRPFRRVRTEAGLEFRYLGGRERVKRGLLEVAVAAGDGELTVFVVHLRSRFTDRPDDPASAICRAGEAGAIRDQVLRRFPDPSAARFVILGDCNDARGAKPLRLLAKRGPVVVSCLLPAADPRGETWTHVYRKEETYTRVDHILVSPGLLPAVAGGRARIYDGPGVSAASDHRPVMVRLEFPRGPDDPGGGR